VVGYWLLNECKDSVAVTSTTAQMMWSTGFKLLVFSFNHIFWAAGLHITGFMLVVPKILCSLTLCSFLETFSDQFYLRGKPNVYESAGIYRFIQILAVLMNAVVHKTLLMLMMGCIFVSSVSLAACVKLKWTFANLFPLSMAFLILFDAMAILVVLLGGMVISYLKAKTIFQCLKGFSAKRLSKKEHKFLRKSCKSCPPFKIRFGKVNFLEPLTPLNCVAFVINLAVQMLLLLN